MPVPIWPSTVPYRPKTSDFKALFSDGQNIATTEMDNGEIRNRLRFVTNMAPVSMTIEMNTSEIGVFKDFWRVSLRQGLFWFQMPIFDGEKYSDNLVRMPPSGQPTLSAIGVYDFDVSFSLLVRNLIR